MLACGKNRIMQVNKNPFEVVLMRKSSARAVAIAVAADAVRQARLRLFVVTIGAAAALLALPVLF